MSIPNSYFYPHNNSVMFRRALGDNAGWADTYTLVCFCESNEQATKIATQLNRDLEQINEQPRATAEHYPGRSSVFKGGIYE